MQMCKVIQNHICFGSGNMANCPWDSIKQKHMEKIKNNVCGAINRIAFPTMVYNTRNKAWKLCQCPRWLNNNGKV